MTNSIRAEWTKFRTVRGWVIGLLTAIPLTVLIGLLGPLGSSFDCAGPNGAQCRGNTPPIGPDGTPVFDTFYFVHRTLTGDGSVTARVGALRDAEPWAKAGLLLKEGTTSGSRYAAVLLTGGHGVRMQYDFTEDIAGPSPDEDRQWLRLTREGTTLTGETSSDGRRWSTVGTVRLDFGERVELGMFVSSPQHLETSNTFGGRLDRGAPTVATTSFDQVRTTGAAAEDWRGTAVGIDPAREHEVGFTDDGGDLTITGTGDIAPIPASAGSLGKTAENALVGAFAGLVAVLVVAALFATSEYRRGIIRTSFTANPRRGQLLAAKAVVVGGLSFVVGAVSSALALPLVERAELAEGFFQHPTTWLTELRLVLGTGLLFAVAAVLAVALGMFLRRGALTVTAVVVGVVLPYLLAVASVLPTGPAEVLVTVTPAAAFAIQQSVEEYPQVAASYTPADGYFPLSPTGGLVVLCGYAAVAVVLAAIATRRRDA
ncbi:DUF1349 domain-containing protein [Actinophytocola xanthii]|uniref:ABC transporter permease n=1 Tax=Actinophytocola xanthii TaxID=1912961 RepID=A0A1Q8CQL6_9PSEU|nr:ABC transporter permease subunit [Actinophytocola xanthii]OLF16654.1 hypothetical protein BU204_15760 [Actinophytocola xanthii]